MFIGHYGLALAAKKSNTGINLGTSVLAAQFPDLLWPFFTLTGLEKFSIEPGITRMNPLNFEYYPFSHSLTGSLLMAFAFALVYFIIKKNGKASLLCALLVFSHWFLDFITHRSDLPLTFTSFEKAGLSLWNYPAASVITESLIYLAGIFLYVSATKAKNSKGVILLWIFIGLPGVLYIMNLAGPPPPSARMVSYSALLLWLFVFMGYWTDRNRKEVNRTRASSLSA